MATLEIRDLHVSVAGAAGDSREILRGVDLTVASGQTHAIMGPNGSGKSTLAYAIAGALDGMTLADLVPARHPGATTTATPARAAS